MLALAARCETAELPRNLFGEKAVLSSCRHLFRDAAVSSQQQAPAITRKSLAQHFAKPVSQE
jgi:hypothetical protein